MRDISPPRNLKPEKRFFKEVGEEMINSDGIIRIMQTVDTPEAKAIYKSFRAIYSKLKEQFPDEPDDRRRNTALMQAIENSGWNVTVRPLE